LLNLAQMLGSVSQACKMMGYARDSFNRFMEMYDKGGELALQEISRRKPCIKNRVEEHTEKAIVELAEAGSGPGPVANELAKRGVMISAAGFRCVWLRNDLEAFSKRLKALEAKAAQEHLILTSTVPWITGGTASFPVPPRPFGKYVATYPVSFPVE